MNLLRILVKSGIDFDGLWDFNLEFLIFNWRFIESTEEVEDYVDNKKTNNPDEHYKKGVLLTKTQAILTSSEKQALSGSVF